ncbi:heparinase II/III domain-containing protein [Halomarina oriensis]|uniref:Heparinase n=1 Tax=Halomarina oriensis TaxID=671145 RepID=A0A6B0GJ18_9EURY|nr:heparinase II/III family protein [Halomarina oriensis]MWG33847.1 heparinase [Halomarina oriensis]
MPPDVIRDYDHEYPPAEWTVDEVARALDAPTGGVGCPLPTYEDESTWATLAHDPPTRSLVAAIREHAARARDDPPPNPTASEFLVYGRTGDRKAYQLPYYAFQRRLSTFALAACFDRDDRYLDLVLDDAWRLCEWTTWLLPAHLPADERHDGLPRPAAGEDHRVALFSARTALLLSDLDRLLGKRLHPTLRERMHEEVDRRVLTPFEATVDEHWGRPPTGNWNAVCNASIAVAALRFETDVDRLARIVTRAVHSLEHYLANFDPDGCTPEGIAYWNFGFGHYLYLDQHLDARTDGALSLRSPPVVREAARFPRRVELSPGRFVPFSDTPEREGLAPEAACYAGLAFDRQGLVARGVAAADRNTPFRGGTETLSECWRTLAWARRAGDRADGTPRKEGTPPHATFFPGHVWWVARADPTHPEGLVVAAKGGHNGEPHNHNDCGSFVVHCRGESLLADLGAPAYDAGYFGEERYDYLTARSLGHSVPYVNGHEQAVGREHAARVLKRGGSRNGGTSSGDTGDTGDSGGENGSDTAPDREYVTFDLTACYPEAAGLDALRRTVALDRAAGGVRVVDDATFDDGSTGDRSWQSVFVSYHPMERTDEGLTIGEHSQGRVAVTTDPQGASVDVERLPEAVPVPTNAEGDATARDVWRARVEPPTGDRSSVGIVVTPGPLD